MLIFRWLMNFIKSVFVVLRALPYYWQRLVCSAYAKSWRFRGLSVHACTRYGQKLWVRSGGCKLRNFRGGHYLSLFLQGRRAAIRGAVSPGAADPVRRLRPSDRREGGRRHQVRERERPRCIEKRRQHRRCILFESFDDVLVQHSFGRWNRMLFETVIFVAEVAGRWRRLKV